ncbi:MAG: methylmalonyl-CoA epimerase [Thermoplasmata archaeon]|nr:methylmalonyl-CoA epimerase [Thermoplasmata archaeon]
MPVDHLGIAVRSLAEALPRWEGPLGATASPPEVVDSQRVRIAFLDAGSTHLEFLEPTAPDSPVAKFLETRGEGLHHLAFAVPNVDRKLAELDSAGYRLIDRVARTGARGRRIAFCHPSAFDGVLVEFVEGEP